jgi:ATP-dependent Lon protease
VTKHIPEEELPRTVWVNYYNKDKDYQQGSQFAMRQITASEHDVTINLPIAMTDAEGIAIGYKQLYLSQLEAEQFVFATDLKYDRVVPTTVVRVRGRVLRVGGIKEKVLAAARSGLKQVILPEQNKSDWSEVPDEVRKKMKVHFVNHISELIEAALKPNK